MSKNKEAFTITLSESWSKYSTQLDQQQEEFLNVMSREQLQQRNDYLIELQAQPERWFSQNEQEQLKHIQFLLNL